MVEPSGPSTKIVPAVIDSSASWPRAARDAARLGLAGMVAALVVAIGGVAVERSRLGTTPQDGRARIAAYLHDRLRDLTASLQNATAALRVESTFPPAAAADQKAVKALFDAADAALESGGGPDGAITVYGPTGVPFAWSGRPSELPLERITGPEALFTHQSPAGLRLVLVRPVVDRTGATPRRIGSTAAERVIAPSQGIRTPVSEGYPFETPVVPVALRPAVEMPERPSSPERLVIGASDDTPLVAAAVSDGEVTAAHARAREHTGAAVIAVVVVTFLLMTGPLLDLRVRARQQNVYVLATIGTAALVVAARFSAVAAHPDRWSTDPLVARTGTGWWSLLAGSPLDFLLTGLAALACAALAAGAAERWRRTTRGRRRRPTQGNAARFIVGQLSAGLVVAALLAAYSAFLGTTAADTSIDLLHFSFHPWNPARTALDVGLVAWHATVLLIGVTIFRFTLRGWIVSTRRWTTTAVLLPLWVGPAAIWAAADARVLGPARFAYVLALLATAALVLISSRVLARARHASQFYRLAVGVAVLLVPAVIWYPTLDRYTDRASRALVEQRFAPEALHQRQTIQQQLAVAREQIDRMQGLVDYAQAAPAEGQPVSTDAALDVWKRTALAAYPLTSAIEIYGPGGALVSRFDFQLPEATASTPQWEESGCRWDVFEEVSPFFSEERRLLHASRGLCEFDPARPDEPPRVRGAIVVHVKLDYSNLPFISSQSPYVQLLRPSDPAQREGVLARDVEYVVYGWSRAPIYVSGAAAWPLPDDVFARVAASRRPFWTTLVRGSQAFEVYLQNDRGGMYALGVPVVSRLEQLVNLAEITALVGVVFVAGLLLAAVYRLVARRLRRGRGLLRELRESFYRKLFLAFVLASVVPVMALAFATRAYVVSQWRDAIEADAIKTAESGRRIVEDYLSNEELRRGTAGVRVNDDLLVWISRLIDQDVNLFQGARLAATSERNLFAAGLLPTRTPGEVYRVITLQQMPSFISDEQIGSLTYMVAAAPVRVRSVEAILTVPLTLRQHEIEREIDELDRRVLLATLLFILTGAALGYWMAERIADPVSRLTRATRRIARGDLDSRILSTSHDELRRLVDAFNSMARDLRAQRGELERTHRLEAWAEMARQVAHEIKNPLTPIQLSAEHLRRVHRDRGEPLTPVLQECVDTILGQVRLLRQIAAEFSSFASAPTVRPAPVSPSELVNDLVESYRQGLEGRVAFVVHVAPDLPNVMVDRTLVSRALANIVENALHAMPEGGTLTITSAIDREGRQVGLRVTDTGVGMDGEALERAFEPYFSTKATGTGLGLPLAKRNIESSGGTIAVESTRHGGTTVTVWLPAA